MYLFVYLCEIKYQDDKLGIIEIGYLQVLAGVRWKGQKNCGVEEIDFVLSIFF